MKQKKIPTAAQLKRKRRKKPVFVDEFIQWHLPNTKHDQCPWCGFKDIAYYGKKYRACNNNFCQVEMRLKTATTEFFRDKLEGETAMKYGEPYHRVVHVDGGRKKLHAQKESRDGRAQLRLQISPVEQVVIYWHREAHQPEDEYGDPVMMIGSDFWFWLELQIGYGDGCPHWLPAEPLNPLEVLARADTDDPVYMVRV